MRSKVITLLIIALVAIGAFYLLSNREQETEQPVQDTTTQTDNTDSRYAFSTPQKSAHYESNTPEHGALLAAAPINVVIDFNFDLAAPSSISITKDGKEYGTGELSIDQNKLSMRRSVDPAAPDGLYEVSYKACWPDKSCHDGHFEFVIDRSLASSYEDLTGKKEVTIKMSEIMFKPENIKVDAGTKITWINDEAVEHYINTDSHPAHTYFPSQNSRSLKLGESYSVTFTDVGIYPYHCSAHAENMKGNILVQ
jgi:plastocyanin/methionine-rich copper-binding protein CopC